MELHWDKFQVLAVGAKGDVCAPDGTALKQVKQLQYLGAHLSADADAGPELGRKIGEAKRVFSSLSKLWSHSYLTWRRKLRIFSSVVESKLLYGLAGACLNKAQTRRLDGFQNRCLRKIIGIKPSWLSRVLNAEVLSRAQHTGDSTLLLYRQMLLFGGVLRSNENSLLRRTTFAPNSFTPATAAGVRRRGAPSREFAPIMLKQSLEIFGCVRATVDAAQSVSGWKRTLRHHILSL
jgi:hypothetical protein